VIAVSFDNSNQDGVRPDALYAPLFKKHTVSHEVQPDGTITELVSPITYYRDSDDRDSGEEVPFATVTLNEANGWTYLYRGVPYADQFGNVFEYFWKEYTVSENAEGDPVYTYTDLNGTITFSEGGDYTLTRSEATQTMDEETGSPMVVTTLTNTHTPAVVRVAATKAWEYENNKYSLRQPVTFRITGSYRGQDNKTHYLTDTDITNPEQSVMQGMVIWENLPKYADEGRTISYVVTETTLVPGYSRVYVYHTTRDKRDADGNPVIDPATGNVETETVEETSATPTRHQLS